MLTKKIAKIQHVFSPKKSLVRPLSGKRSFFDFFIFCSSPGLGQPPPPPPAPGAGPKSGVAKMRPPISIRFLIKKTSPKPQNREGRVQKKYLFLVLIGTFLRRVRSPGWGRGDHQRGAGRLPAAASAAPIYNFYNPLAIFDISFGGACL